MMAKAKDKKQGLMLGDFIVAAYRTWGKRRANGFVRLFVNARLVVFRGRRRFMIAEE
jgi:hypothetical protein